MSTLDRPLGYYERYHVARSNLGTAFHPTIVLGASLSLPPSADIHTAVSALLQRYPLLSCAIAGHRTRTPRYERQAVTAADVCSVLNFSPGTGEKDAESWAQATIERETLRALNDPRWALDTAPLWRVVWHPYAAPADPTAGQRGALLLITHHVLSDGRGALTLLSELIALLSSTSPQNTPAPSDTALPLSQESTLPCAPRPLTLLLTILAEVVLPALLGLLPAFLRRLVARAPKTEWPPASSSPAPAACPATGHALWVPQATVARLKLAGRARGLKTLQPVIMAAGTRALARILHTNSSGDVGSPSVEVRIETARSLRDPAVGHPRATGNYVAGSSFDLALVLPRTSDEKDKRAQSDAAVWGHAARYAAQLASPSVRAADVGNMGMLKYIPDPEVHNGEGEGAKEVDGKGPTGWEDYFRARAESPRPYRSALELSNLGLCPPISSSSAATTTEGKEGSGESGAVVLGLWFAQNPGPMTAALGLNLVSYPGAGMGVWVNWRAGAVPGLEAFKDAFEEEVRRIVEEEA